METLREVSLPVAKVILGIALGVVALIGTELLVRVIWPSKNPTIRDLLLLLIGVIALVIFRKKYPKPSKKLPKGWFSKDQEAEIDRRVAIAKRRGFKKADSFN